MNLILIIHDLTIVYDVEATNSKKIRKTSRTPFNDIIFKVFVKIWQIIIMSLKINIDALYFG